MINFQGRVKNHLSYRDGYLSSCVLVAQTVNNLPAIGRPGFDPWDREDTLEKEMAAHSCIPAGESTDREAWQTTSPWGHKESDKTEQLILSLFFYLSAEDQMLWEMEGEKEGAGWMKYLS